MGPAPAGPLGDRLSAGAPWSRLGLALALAGLLAGACEPRQAAVLHQLEQTPTDDVLKSPQLRDAALKLGKSIAGRNCASCHGADMKGRPQAHAPDLTDAYWLYGDSTEALRTTINEGRHGVMPAHGPLLGETRARLVAAYVWSLSHGNKGADTPR